MGSEAMERLKQCRVILFGVGGVGGFAGEALVRGGIGSITVVDHDTVGLTNLNRQIIALHSTLGMKKVEVFRRRALDINPDLNITALDSFLLPDNVGRFELSGYDYIVDAIDTVSAKIALAVTAEQTGVPLISCMGTGNKLDPFRFRITDVYKTSVCPLARVMRRELKARGVSHLKVLYSDEPPLTPAPSEEISGKRQTPGSISFVPPAAGLMIAGEVIKDLIHTLRE